MRSSPVGAMPVYDVMQVLEGAMQVTEFHAPIGV